MLLYQSVLPSRKLRFQFDETIQKPNFSVLYKFQSDVSELGGNAKIDKRDLQKYYSNVSTSICLNFVLLLNSLISQKYQMKQWLFPGL